MQKNNHPLIKRSSYFSHFPQLPSWFCSFGHIEAREKFRHKIRTVYKYESVENCSLCNSTEYFLLAIQERHGIPTSVVLCVDCGLVRTQCHLDKASLHDHYKSEAQALKRGARPAVHSELFNLQREKGQRIWEFLNLPEIMSKTKNRQINCVVEIGCGEGGGLDIFSKHCAFATGFELNPLAVEYGRSKGLNLYNSEFKREFLNQKCDLIIYEQVLEHILNVNEELHSLSEQQEEGDLFYIGVPGLMNFPHHYKFNFLSYLEYQHMHHFTLGTLERLLAKHGYKLIFGNEIIQALFIKLRPDEKIKPITSDQKANDIIKFIRDAEESYQKGRGESFSAHLRYLIYFLAYKFGLRTFIETIRVKVKGQKSVV